MGGHSGSRHCPHDCSFVDSFAVSITFSLILEFERISLLKYVAKSCVPTRDSESIGCVNEVALLPIIEDSFRQYSVGYCRCMIAVGCSLRIVPSMPFSPEN